MPCLAGVMPETWHNISTGFSNAILNPDVATPIGVHGPHSGKADRRYAVYRNNVTLSLIGALEANFPAVKRLVGGEFFAGMARMFVRAHPPKSRLLAEYGDELAAFIETFEPLAAYPFIPDVARLERLWLDSYHEADALVLDGAQLASLDPEALFASRFAVHPAARLFASPYAAVTILSANRAEGQVAVIDPSQPEFGLVTRPLLQVDVRTISASSHFFLIRLIEGHTLAAAAEAGMENDPKFDLAANLQGMLAAGVFTSLKHETQE
jgi:Putative DNA-binding domain